MKCGSSLSVSAPTSGSFSRSPISGSSSRTPTAGSFSRSPIAGSSYRTPTASSFSRSPIAGQSSRTPTAGLSSRSPTAGLSSRSLIAGAFAACASASHIQERTQKRREDFDEIFGTTTAKRPKQNKDGQFPIAGGDAEQTPEVSRSPFTKANAPQQTLLTSNKIVEISKLKLYSQYQTLFESAALKAKRSISFQEFRTNILDNLMQNSLDIGCA